MGDLEKRLDLCRQIRTTNDWNVLLTTYEVSFISVLCKCHRTDSGALQHAHLKVSDRQRGPRYQCCLVSRASDA